MVVGGGNNSMRTDSECIWLGVGGGSRQSDESQANKPANYNEANIPTTSKYNPLQE